MATIRVIDEQHATGQVRAIYEEIKAALRLPFVPQLFQALAVNPDHLAATWGQMQAVLLRGTLDMKTKAMVALAVAGANRCPYFVSAYTAVLKRLGATESELEELMSVVQLAVGLNAYAEGLELAPDLKT